MLSGATRVKKGQLAILRYPLFGKRFYTGIDEYDVGIEMWEIDSDRWSSTLGSENYSYDQLRDKLHSVTGFGGAVTSPQQTAVMAVVQPILMAVAKHFEKPDRLFSTRFSTLIQENNLPAKLPLVPGVYIVEDPDQDERRRLTRDHTLDNNYIVRTGGNLNKVRSNYLVVQVEVDNSGISVEQTRRDLLAFRDRLRNQGQDLLPQPLRAVIQNQNPTDVIVGQLELNDLKRRYRVRLKRTAKNKISALAWFAEQVRNGTLDSDGPPLFTEHHIRDAVNFMSQQLEVKPLLTTDDPKEVFQSWSGLIESREPSGEAIREFTYDSQFRISRGAETWYLKRLMESLKTTSNSSGVSDLDKVRLIKESLQNYLDSIDSTEPRNKLTLNEQDRLLANFRNLFVADYGTQSPPEPGTASRSSKARAFMQWLSNPELYLEVITGNEQAHIRGDIWSRAILAKADKKLRELHDANVEKNNPEPDLYTLVLSPVMEAYESTDASFSSQKSKDLLSSWLKGHAITVGSNPAAWRSNYYSKRNTLISRELNGTIAIIPDGEFKSALKGVDREINLVIGTSTVPTGIALYNMVNRLVRLIETFGDSDKNRLMSVVSKTFVNLNSLDGLKDLRNAKRGNQYLIEYRDGRLLSTRSEYYDAGLILAGFREFPSKTEEDRMALLRRAVDFITSNEGSQDDRLEIYNLLVGETGITDFVADNEAQRFNRNAWDSWFTQRPEWSSQARQYIRLTSTALAEM